MDDSFVHIVPVFTILYHSGSGSPIKIPRTPTQWWDSVCSHLFTQDLHGNDRRCVNNRT